MSSFLPKGKFFSNLLMDDCRQKMDFLADEVIADIYKNNGVEALRNLVVWLTNPDLTNSISSGFESVDSFIENLTLPVWANQTKIEQGCAFFKEHQDAIPILLGCYSLPYCYAAANGAEVLMLSERIYKDTQKRLEETAMFVFSMADFENWKDKSVMPRIAKVRLLHASIRVFCKKSPKWQHAWGMPINQEDMAGTNLAFSYVVIKGLRKFNKTLDAKRLDNYLHLWNVIGFMLGVEEVLLPQNIRQAFLLDQAIAKRQFRVSVAGQSLTKSLTDTLERLIPDSPIKSLPTAMMRFLVGDAIADLLNLPALTIEKNLIKFIPTNFLFKSPNRVLLN